jgi:hypothetical protein
MMSAWRHDEERGTSLKLKRGNKKEKKKNE